MLVTFNYINIPTYSTRSKSGKIKWVFFCLGFQSIRLYGESMKSSAINIFLLETPADAGERLLSWRLDAKITQDDLSKKLGLTRRYSISDYERGEIPITNVMYSLAAIILGKHQNTPGNIRIDNKTIVYDTRQMQTDVAYFISKNLSNKGWSLKRLSEQSGITVNRLNEYLKDKAEPSQKDWASIQIALDEYASGFNYSKELIAARNKANISQQEAARISGVTSQSISNFENNRTIPKSQTWSALMLALGFHPQITLNNKEISEDNIFGKV